MWPKNLIAVNYTRPERLKFLASLLYLRMEHFGLIQANQQINLI